MKKPHSIIFLFSILFISSFSACQQKDIQSIAIEETQKREVLFLTLKTTKTDAGMSAELIEKVIRTDNNYPRGTGEPEQGDTFRCEIFNSKGIVIFTSVKKFDFTFKTETGDSYSFLKFFETLPEGYDSVLVSAEVSEGVWQELYISQLN